MTMRRFTIKAFLVFTAIMSAGISSTMAKDWTGITPLKKKSRIQETQKARIGFVLK